MNELHKRRRHKRKIFWRSNDWQVWKIRSKSSVLFTEKVRIWERENQEMEKVHKRREDWVESIRKLKDVCSQGRHDELKSPTKHNTTRHFWDNCSKTWKLWFYGKIRKQLNMVFISKLDSKYEKLCPKVYLLLCGIIWDILFTF